MDLKNQAVGSADVKHSLANQSLSVEALTSLAELLRLEPHWQGLFRRSREATAFASPAAVQTWYRNVEPHSGIYAVSVWCDDVLVGMATFSTIRLGYFRLLVTTGAGFGFHGDPLLGSDPAPVANAIIDHLRDFVSSGTGAVYLRRLRTNWTMANALDDRDDVTCQPMGSDESNSLIRFDQMNDPEDYFAAVARKHAVPRRRRRLLERFERVDYVPDDPDPHAAMDDMRDMMYRRFGMERRTYRTPQNRKLIHDLVDELMATDNVKVSSLVADGTRIASTIALYAGSRTFWYVVSSEPDLKWYGLGHIELYDFLYNAYQYGVTEVDLGSTNFDYKHRWANAVMHHRTVAIMAPGLRGTLANNLRRAAIRLHRARKLDDAGHGGPHVV
jgi:CelD/BcsL family acetyltransferase involved in cellulose biosynthesis